MMKRFPLLLVLVLLLVLDPLFATTPLKDAQISGSNSEITSGTFTIKSGANFNIVSTCVLKLDGSAVGANQLLSTDSSGNVVKTTITTFALSLLDDTNAATARATLGLQIGTNVQAYDPDLTTWAAVTPGTGVTVALAVNVGSAGAFLVNGGALGTPSSGNASNLTNIPMVNATGTLSVANGGLGYKVYAALLTQSGTSAPTATVLANTLGGTVVWTRHSMGVYYGTLAGAFPAGKVPTLSGYARVTDGPSAFEIDRLSNDAVILQTQDGPDGAFLDDQLNETFIEIRVYP